MGWDGSAYDTYSHNNGAVVLFTCPGDAFWVYSGGFNTYQFKRRLQVHSWIKDLEKLLKDQMMILNHSRTSPIKFSVND